MSGALQELLDVALEAAHVAETPILEGFRHSVVSHKADGSEVTEADRRGEEVIRELLARRFPDHAILGEEFGGGEVSTGWQWVIDPIDGTASFVLGSPMFGTLVGLLEDGEPVVGVVHAPALHETVYAGRGLGCWFVEGGGAPARVKVSTAAQVSDAVVLGPSHSGGRTPAERERRVRRLLPLVRRARKFQFGGDCLRHALVCRGVAHAAIDLEVSPWDIAAVVPCVEEAGGVVSTAAGDRNGIVFRGSLVSCCGSSLLREVVALLSTPASKQRTDS